MSIGHGVEKPQRSTVQNMFGTSLGFPVRREWRVESGGDERRAEKEGGGSFPRQASSPHLMQIGYSVQRGARRASSSLVPRLAPRGFPGRQGWRGGERQGWRVSAVRKGGGCAECEKGHGRGRVTFPPLGSVLTSHRSDSRSGTKWWGAASLPRVDQVPGSAGMVGRERDAKRHGHRAWAAVCAGERTDDGAGPPLPRRSGSRFSAGRRGEERARCGPTRLNAIRPALFVRGDSLWIPAATYLPGPSPAKYCRRMRA